MLFIFSFRLWTLDDELVGVHVLSESTTAPSERSIARLKLGPTSFSADARNNEIPLLCCFQMHTTMVFLSKENCAVLHLQ